MVSVCLKMREVWAFLACADADALMRSAMSWGTLATQVSDGLIPNFFFEDLTPLPGRYAFMRPQRAQHDQHKIVQEHVY